MPTANANLILSVAGLSLQGVISRVGEGQLSDEVSLPAAEYGTLSTRVGDTSGTLTLQSGHGISSADVIDIFWVDANGVLKCAYGATVGTVAGTYVPFTGASGDALPDQDYVITADEQVEIIRAVDGDELLMVGIMSSKTGRFDYVTAAPASLYQRLFAGANEPWFWISDLGYANPLTGAAIAKILVTNANKDAAATVKSGMLHDSVA